MAEKLCRTKSPEYLSQIVGHVFKLSEHKEPETPKRNFSLAKQELKEVAAGQGLLELAVERRDLLVADLLTFFVTPAQLAAVVADHSVLHDELLSSLLGHTNPGPLARLVAPDAASRALWTCTTREIVVLQMIQAEEEAERRAQQKVSDAAQQKVTGMETISDGVGAEHPALVFMMALIEAVLPTTSCSSTTSMLGPHLSRSFSMLERLVSNVTPAAFAVMVKAKAPTALRRERERLAHKDPAAAAAMQGVSTQFLEDMIQHLASMAAGGATACGRRGSVARDPEAQSALQAMLSGLVRVHGELSTIDLLLDQPSVSSSAVGELVSRRSRPWVSDLLRNLWQSWKPGSPSGRASLLHHFLAGIFEDERAGGYGRDGRDGRDGVLAKAMLMFGDRACVDWISTVLDNLDEETAPAGGANGNAAGGANGNAAGAIVGEGGYHLASLAHRHGFVLTKDLHAAKKGAVNLKAAHGEAMEAREQEHNQRVKELEAKNEAKDAVIERLKLQLLREQHARVQNKAGPAQEEAAAAAAAKPKRKSRSDTTASCAMAVWTSFMGRFKGKVESWSQRVTRSLIYQLYVAKIDADDRDTSNGDIVSPMAEFVLEYFLQQYGTPKVYCSPYLYGTPKVYCSPYLSLLSSPIYIILALLY
jgi:hypothetical protein